MEKRHVQSYIDSLRSKMSVIAEDLTDLSQIYRQDQVQIIEGSYYDALPNLPDNSIDSVITSPPYANRYDYTRTCALELAWLGYDNRKISELRQRLLSATVENRSKREQLAANHSDALTMFDHHPAVNEITDALESARGRKELPNPQVIRLVRNYFMEMAAVIAELSREQLCI
jgi:tRNA G10  N-methylase Trm11